MLAGPAPVLYSSMGWMALLMELWGTHHGVWAWARVVPWTSLTAWNPPILVGAFYGFGDLLVNLAVDALAPATPAAAARGGTKKAA